MMDILGRGLRLPLWLGGAFLVVALVAGATWGRARYRAGQQETEVRWQARQWQAEAAERARLQKTEEEHRNASGEITQKLVAAREEYAVSLRRLDADYAERLRRSDARARLYEGAAASGTDQCRDLGRHAAELDRSLEEGRDLVAKLAGLVGQREQQMRLLGEQIRADRQVIEG